MNNDLASHGFITGDSDTYNGYFKVTNASETDDDGNIIALYINITEGLLQLNDNIINVSSVKLNVNDSDTFIILRSSLLQTNIITSNEFEYAVGESNIVIATFNVEDGIIKNLTQQNHGQPLGIILGKC